MGTIRHSFSTHALAAAAERSGNQGSLRLVLNGEWQSRDGKDVQVITYESTAMEAHSLPSVKQVVEKSHAAMPSYASLR